MRGTFVTELIIYVSLLLAAINVMAIMILLRYLLKSSNIHRNSKFLAYSGCFAYLMLELGEVCVFTNLAIRTACPLPGSGISVPGCEDIYYVCRAILHGVLLAESMCIAACVERTLSTFVDNYEKRSFTCAALCLLVFSHAVAMLLSLATWQWKMSIEVHNMIRIGYDVLCLVYCAALYRYNQRLNKKVHRKGGHLSRRYQLSENVRVTRFLLQLLLVSCVMAIFLSSSLAYVQHTALRPLSVGLYWMLLNIYVLICLLLVGRRQIASFYRKCIRRKTIAPTITDQEDIDMHFRNLNTMWL